MRTVFREGWGEGDVRLTPEKSGRMNVRRYLMMLGQHRYVLSPRGNGLDAHRTWEALLVGAIPIVRSSALNPLYERLPILVIHRWEDVTPALLRDFYPKVRAPNDLQGVSPLPPPNAPRPRFPLTRSACAGARAAQALPLRAPLRRLLDRPICHPP